MAAHAKLAPSASARWINCIGSIAATEGIPNTTNIYTMEGTAAHILGQRALDHQKPCEFFRGEEIGVLDDDEKEHVFLVNDEMIENVQVYIDAVNRQPGDLLVEQEFDLSAVYGVPEQFGTSDAVKMDYENEHLWVGDLKYGRGVVVYAKDNTQGLSYAAGAYEEYKLLGDWKTITIAIIQPRCHHYDEWTITREELEAWIESVKAPAAAAMTLIGAHPQHIENAKTAGAAQCNWCPLNSEDRKGQPLCKTAADWAHKQIYDGFSNLEAETPVAPEASLIDGPTLAKLVERADAVIKIAQTWRAEATRRATAVRGSIPGYKMVSGKKGARKFSDEDEAEAIMKAARIKADEMYSKKLITAPAAEKVLKKKPKIWAKLQPLITQADGAPSLAPDDDKRPELVVAEAEAFGDVTEDYKDLL